MSLYHFLTTDFILMNIKKNYFHNDELSASLIM